MLFINFPSLRLSPRSFLARRERQNAAGVLRAEHNWFLTPTAAREQRSADYKSAIRQIKNLRYAKHVRTALSAWFAPWRTHRVDKAVRAPIRDRVIGQARG